MLNTLISKNMTLEQAIEVAMQSCPETLKIAVTGLLSCYVLEGKTPFEALKTFLLERAAQFESQQES